MRTYINLNIYDSNLHLLILFFLGTLGLYMLFTFKVEQKPKPEYYNKKNDGQEFDYDSFSDLLKGILIIVTCVVLVLLIN
ncbi:hypothetical protein [Emticicia fontis]